MSQATATSQRTLTSWRVWVLWLLALALPVYGASSTSVRLLGPAHWHTAPTEVHPASQDWLQPALEVLQGVLKQVQEVRARVHARAHAARQHHEHHSLLRHWHSAEDSSVQTVGGIDPAVGDLVSGASVGSAALILALPTVPWRAVDPGTAGAWPHAQALAWKDADPTLLSPPPRA